MARPSALIVLLAGLAAARRRGAARRGRDAARGGGRVARESARRRHRRGRAPRAGRRGPARLGRAGLRLALPRRGCASGCPAARGRPCVTRAAIRAARTRAPRARACAARAAAGSRPGSWSASRCPAPVTRAGRRLAANLSGTRTDHRQVRRGARAARGRLDRGAQRPPRAADGGVHPRAGSRLARPRRRRGRVRGHLGRRSRRRGGRGLELGLRRRHDRRGPHGHAPLWRIRNLQGRADGDGRRRADGSVADIVTVEP